MKTNALDWHSDTSVQGENRNVYDFPRRLFQFSFPVKSQPNYPNMLTPGQRMLLDLFAY